MSFFRKKSLFIILIGLIVLVLLIGYSLTKRNQLSTVEAVLIDTVGTVQSVLNKPVNTVVNFFKSIDDVKSTYKENRLLREKIAEYKTLAYENQELENENEELRKLLEITDSARDYEPISAHVIARSPEQWLEQLTINRGSNHGVRKNMAVITVDGMIGKVKAVAKTHSTVQLITGFDQLNRVSATISKKKLDNVFGLIEGYDKENSMLIFRVIEDSNQKIKKQDQIVTSHLGGIFPSGIPIGEIEEITPDKYGLTKTALVKPSANLNDINQVIVINRQLDTVDVDAEIVEEEVEEE